MMKFTRNIKTLRHGNRHISYNAPGVLIEQYGIGWAVYFNNVYAAAFGRVSDAKAFATDRKRPGPDGIPAQTL